MKSNNKEYQKEQECPEHNRPDEIPEKRESEHEKFEYPREIEQQQQQGGSDSTYSEQTEVTLPKNIDVTKTNKTDKNGAFVDTDGKSKNYKGGEETVNGPNNNEISESADGDTSENAGVFK